MDIQAWSIENWKKIPEADRKRCLDHLRIYMGDVDGGRATLAKWRAQARSTVNGEPVRIGSDDIRFHFGVGMAIRNVLRQVITDDRLPGPVNSGRGLSCHRNWDDFYIGAIHALASEPAPWVNSEPHAPFLRNEEEAKSFDLIADQPVFYFLDWLDTNGFKIVPKEIIAILVAAAFAAGAYAPEHRQPAYTKDFAKPSEVGCAILQRHRWGIGWC